MPLNKVSQCLPALDAHTHTHHVIIIRIIIGRRILIMSLAIVLDNAALYDDHERWERQRMAAIIIK